MGFLLWLSHGFLAFPYSLFPLMSNVTTFKYVVYSHSTHHLSFSVNRVTTKSGQQMVPYSILHLFLYKLFSPLSHTALRAWEAKNFQ